VLQVCCRCVAGVLQCVVVCRAISGTPLSNARTPGVLQCVACVLQSVAVCCGSSGTPFSNACTSDVSQGVAVCYGVLQCVWVGVFQCVAVSSCVLYVFCSEFR